MQVYQTDQDGFYVRPTIADPDPLDIGNWLIPRGAVEIAPPSLQGGEKAQWTGDSWVIVLPPEEVIEPQPQLPSVSQTLSFAQMLIGLVSEGWITEAEGEAWLSGTLPFVVLTLIGALPQGERFAARARASRPSFVERSDPLVSALANMQGKTQEELDQFFTTYGAV